MLRTAGDLHTRHDVGPRAFNPVAPFFPRLVSVPSSLKCLHKNFPQKQRKIYGMRCFQKKEKAVFFFAEAPGAEKSWWLASRNRPGPEYVCDGVEILDFRIFVGGYFCFRGSHTGFSGWSYIIAKDMAQNAEICLIF